MISISTDKPLQAIVAEALTGASHESMPQAPLQPQRSAKRVTASGTVTVSRTGNAHLISSDVERAVTRQAIESTSKSVRSLAAYVYGDGGTPAQLTHLRTVALSALLESDGISDHEDAKRVVLLAEAAIEDHRALSLRGDHNYSEQQLASLLGMHAQGFLRTYSSRYNAALRALRDLDAELLTAVSQALEERAA